mgnify:CR=1 FL=1
MKKALLMAVIPLILSAEEKPKEGILTAIQLADLRRIIARSEVHTSELQSH